MSIVVLRRKKYISCSEQGAICGPSGVFREKRPCGGIVSSCPHHQPAFPVNRCIIWQHSRRRSAGIELHSFRWGATRYSAMNRRILIIVSCALVLSVCASYLVYQAVGTRVNAAKPPQTVEIVVAARDLAFGTLVHDADFKM